jgi:hypothetical protein
LKGREIRERWGIGGDGREQDDLKKAVFYTRL